MQEQNLVLDPKLGKIQRKVILFAIGLVTCALMIMGSGSHVYADSTMAAASNDVSNDVDGQRKEYGIVKEVAGNDFVGHWTISEHLYLVTSHTKFGDGEPSVGDCVMVKYYGHGSVRVAKQINMADADQCADDGDDSDDGSGDDGDDSDDGDDDDGDDSDDGDDDDGGDMDDGDDDEMPQEIDEQKGIVETLPADSLVGGWMIGGVKYVTTEDTKFEQDEGALLAGACVEIKYSGDKAPFTIIKIETEEPEDCMDSGTVDMPPTGPVFKDYGRIEALPDDATLQGEWTVNGINYLVTNATNIHRWHGRFSVGTCVKVLYFDGEPPFVAKKIMTSKRHHCSGEDDDQGFARGVLFGQIRDFPEQLTGDWNVGGMTFTASDSTNFNQKKGDFGEGVTVKVKFYLDDDGVQQATDIKTMFRLWQDDDSGDDGGGDDGDDGDDDNTYDGLHGHAFGTIDSFPADLFGDWTIGGIDYKANAKTRFRQNARAFDEDVSVRVRYYIDESGNRVATQIKSKGGSATIPGRHKLCGFIKTLPAFGFAGDWMVDGVDLLAEETAEFDETVGLLGLGSYAEIEYGERNGRYYIHKIKMHVPPGAADNNSIGKLSRRTSSSTEIGAASIDAEYETWEIAGQSYLITPATDLDEQVGELVVGSTVAVNSYTDADGNEVATKINTVTSAPATFMDQFIFLPMINR